MNSNPKSPVVHRHIPQRTCVACRDARAKKELVRLIWDDGIAEIDNSGKKLGRGAYLCPIYECWESALKKNRLEHALRSRLSLANQQSLAEYGRSLPRREER